MCCRAIFLFILLSPLYSYSQSPVDDEITFQSAVDWLNRKLNYIYFDHTSQKWWLNKFYVNEKKEVTIKNIFTDKPKSANIKEKVYLIRTFPIDMINPYTMSITDIDEHQGRITKGKLLEIRTFGNEKRISKTVDGRRASNTSFVHISFPTFMTDSITNYAELVKSKLKDAIIAATKVRTSGNRDKERELVFDILKGNFSTESGDPFQAEERMSNVLAINRDDNTEYFFGFDESLNRFYFTKISTKGITTEFYEILPGKKLTLQNVNLKADLIEFETLHSFRMNNLNFYRN